MAFFIQNKIKFISNATVTLFVTAFKDCARKISWPQVPNYAVGYWEKMCPSFKS